jgi:hypothetical protein
MVAPGGLAMTVVAKNTKIGTVSIIRRRARSTDDMWILLMYIPPKNASLTRKLKHVVLLGLFSLRHAYQ